MTLKRCPRFGIVVVAAVLVMPITSFAGAATVCDYPAEGSTFHLVAVHPTAAEEQTATREEMDGIAARIGVSDTVREVHPMMLLTAQAGTNVELDNRPIQGHDAAGKSYFCDVPFSIIITIGAFKQTIFLYQEAAATPCVRDALLRHQRQHSQLLDAAIESFVNEHRDALDQHIRELMRKTTPDALSATKALEAGLASLLSRLYRDFQIAVERSREEADSPSALDQLRNACDGKMRQLEREFSAPHGRRASLQYTCCKLQEAQGL